MASNIEIKARVPDPAALRAAAERLSDTPATVLHQEDTFFHSPQGRLKLRRFDATHGELIYYERTDTAGPKRSNYFITRTSEPDMLKGVLAAAYGVRGVVRKTRTLYLVGQTRIHLDDVDGLGAFMELEVVLQPGQQDAHGQAVADTLMAQLGIAPADLIEGAYIDLLQGLP
jgi:predicted adenylyl cyclase CyaB